MIFKAIFYVQHFCSFGAKLLIIVNLLIKTDSTVICVPCLLEHFCYKPFSLQLQVWKISYVNWLNFVYCLKFTSLRPDSSK